MVFAKNTLHSHPRIVLIIISILAVLWLQAPRLLDQFQVEEDFRTFHWMNKYQEPTLFPNDELGGYRYVNVHLSEGELPLYFYSLGYGLLFYAASFFVTPILFSKILPFFLMPVAIWYLYEFGRTVRGRGPTIVLVLGFIFLDLASPTSLSVIPGLQRSFALPLIIAFIYYLHRQKYIATAVVLVICALIYPPVFLLAVTAWGLFILRIEWPISLRQWRERGLITLLVAFFLGALILSPILLPRFTPLFTVEAKQSLDEPAANSTPENEGYLWDDPKYQAGGRAPLFYVFPFIGRGGLVNKHLDALHMVILFTIGCMIYLVRGRRAFDLPFVIWCVLLGSLITFIAAWISILLTNSFLLYIPSRYTRVGIFLFLLVFVFLNSIDALKEATILLRRNQKNLVWFIGGIEVAALGLILMYPPEHAIFMGLNLKWLLAPTALIFGVLGMIRIRNRLSVAPDLSKITGSLAGRLLIGTAVVLVLSGWMVYAPLVSNRTFLNPDPAERELLKFLETLPQDTLIAGSPCALDSVPLFSKRQILFSCEKISQDTQLVREALRVYYTDDKQAVADFCQKQSIDYLVIDLRTYSDEFLAEEVIFFEPFNQELLPYVAARDTFTLAEVPDQAKIFQSGDFFVVPCDHFAG